MSMESKESLLSLKFVHASEMMALPSPTRYSWALVKYFLGEPKRLFSNI